MERPQLWQILAVIANTNIQCGIIQYFVPRDTANYSLSYITFQLHQINNYWSHGQLVIYRLGL